jgi:predicted SnoaL-like aldol condensation-catalyzing enzyme
VLLNLTILNAQNIECVKPEWKSALVLTLVSGPYVVMMWDRKDKDPDEPAKEHIWNHFDVLRVENGLIKEHWDEARIASRAGGSKHNPNVPQGRDGFRQFMSRVPERTPQGISHPIVTLDPHTNPEWTELGRGTSTIGRFLPRRPGSGSSSFSSNRSRRT